MPLYEYECEACGVRFEQIQKFSDPHVEVCPTCGGVVHKLMSLPSIRFKGSGWYVNDYAQKGKAPEAAAAEPKKASESTEREKSSPSGNTSSSSPSTPSTGSSSSES